MAAASWKLVSELEEPKGAGSQGGAVAFEQPTLHNYGPSIRTQNVPKPIGGEAPGQGYPRLSECDSSLGVGALGGVWSGYPSRRGSRHLTRYRAMHGTML